MKAKKSCLNYLLILLTALTLCACTRSAPRVESYSASGGADQSAGQTELGGNQDGENKGPITDRPASEVQAEFDAFTDQVFRDELKDSSLSLHCFVRYPENYGIDVSEMTLGEISPEILKESFKEIRAMQDTLRSFETGKLTSEQLFTYKMLEDYLETELMAEGLELYYQPLSATIGTQAQLPILFAEYTFNEKQDVENYLTLLSQIDVYYSQLAAFEQARADAGLGPSDVTLDRILQSCKNYMIRAENSFLTETFDSKLEELPDLTEQEKQNYKTRHIDMLKNHFIPAYQNLTEDLEKLKGTGSNENGLFYYERGKDYYEYLVKSLTGTDLTVPELKRQVEKRLGGDLAEISLLVQNNPELVSEVSEYSFHLTDPVQILEDLKEQCKTDFPALPNATFTVKQVPKALEASLSPAFFLIPPIDSFEKNTIYINGGAEEAGGDLYTTLAHEGYPGHLYQTVYFHQKKSCPLRHLLGCNGYAEGWGTYAEIYSYSFENGLSEPLKKALAHNQSSVLALYALLDIHIHYDGWDLEKCSDFLHKYYGIDDPEVEKEIYQSLIDNPANYLTYYTGYMEISSMYDTAKSALGDRFEPKTFHKFILDMEGAPFRVIKPYFQTWLLTYDVR